MGRFGVIQYVSPLGLFLFSKQCRRYSRWCSARTLRIVRRRSVLNETRLFSLILCGGVVFVVSLLVVASAVVTVSVCLLGPAVGIRSLSPAGGVGGMASLDVLVEAVDVCWDMVVSC